MELEFEKWEGLGNDFIVVGQQPASPDEVRRMCDRRRGIGADGVLVVSRTGELAGRMLVFNADGSRPEMCGNGIRCVAGHLLGTWLSKQAMTFELGGEVELTLEIATDAGTKSCTVRGGAQREVEVEVDMGVVRFEGELELLEMDTPYRFARASIGNPHAVTFDPIAEKDLERVGREVDELMGGTNVEFAQSEQGALGVVVRERGVGFTQACGTGACATAAVACKQQRASYEEWLRVQLPGGVLEVRVGAGDAEGTGQVRMRGPARHVFSGTWHDIHAV